jgi:hypothetical protein
MPWQTADRGGHCRPQGARGGEGGSVREHAPTSAPPPAQRHDHASPPPEPGGYPQANIARCCCRGSPPPPPCSKHRSLATRRPEAVPVPRCCWLLAAGHCRTPQQKLAQHGATFVVPYILFSLRAVMNVLKQSLCSRGFWQRSQWRIVRRPSACHIDARADGFEGGGHSSAGSLRRASVLFLRDVLLYFCFYTRNLGSAW